MQMLNPLLWAKHEIIQLSLQLLSPLLTADIKNSVAARQQRKEHAIFRAIEKVASLLLHAGLQLLL